MKIFLSHSSKDVNIIEPVLTFLTAEGYDVITSSSINHGDIWNEYIKKVLNACDVMVAIVTENYNNSVWESSELTYAVFNSSIMVLPFLINNAFTPTILMGISHIKVKSMEDLKNNIIIEIKKISTPNRYYDLLKNEISEKNEKEDTNSKILLLHKALIERKLTLVCGAGVSKSSSIPLWSELVANIVADVFDFDNNDEFVNKLLLSINRSNIILGKYLKIILKDNFENVLRKHLYRDIHDEDTKFKESDLIGAISKLAQINSESSGINSIITFNFDDLIENSLKLNKINYCSIWKESQEIHSGDLPIYHVHGFIPQQFSVDDSGIVFSEDDYHSQFIDPYSWSNMIQLSTFASKVCLFVGLSLSDPNLRRLLDISSRRNPQIRHYIIERKLSCDDKINNITNMLFEQDANSLGINVIWCSDYAEIPRILNKIAMADQCL